MPAMLLSTRRAGPPPPRLMAGRQEPVGQPGRACSMRAEERYAGAPLLCCSPASQKMNHKPSTTAATLPRAWAAHSRRKKWREQGLERGGCRVRVCGQTSAAPSEAQPCSCGCPSRASTGCGAACRLAGPLHPLLSTRQACQHEHERTSTRRRHPLPIRRPAQQHPPPCRPSCTAPCRGKRAPAPRCP